MDNFDYAEFIEDARMKKTVNRSGGTSGNR
jgi:hypothetical protein